MLTEYINYPNVRMTYFIDKDLLSHGVSFWDPKCDQQTVI